METWEVMSKWMKMVHDDELFKQSAQIAGDRLTKAEQAWSQFRHIPQYFLKTPEGRWDREDFNLMSAFLVYQWEAVSIGGLSLGSCLGAHYNAAFTLLRSCLELVLKGALFQCLARDGFRSKLSPALKETDTVKMLATHLSTMIKEGGKVGAELESYSFAIFNLLKGDYLQLASHLEVKSIAQQVADWGILNGVPNPKRTVLDLYRGLSRNVHEQEEYTDTGRALHEGAKAFQHPAPILPQSLSEFLDEFRSVMDLGVITLLNLLHHTIPHDRLRDKSQQLLDHNVFEAAKLRETVTLLQSWGTQGKS